MCDLTPCPDCKAMPGERHQDGCDVERCPKCGGQLISCRHTVLVDNRIPWSGEWPGEMECREFDWWVYWGDAPVHGGPWIRCERDHPGARADLNRLYMGEAVWSIEQKRWVLRCAK